MHCITTSKCCPSSSSSSADAPNSPSEPWICTIRSSAPSALAPSTRSKSSRMCASEEPSSSIFRKSDAFSYFANAARTIAERPPVSRSTTASSTLRSPCVIRKLKYAPRSLARTMSMAGSPRSPAKAKGRGGFGALPPHSSHTSWMSCLCTAIRTAAARVASCACAMLGRAGSEALARTKARAPSGEPRTSSRIPCRASSPPASRAPPSWIVGPMMSDSAAIAKLMCTWRESSRRKPGIAPDSGGSMSTRPRGRPPRFRAMRATLCATSAPSEPPIRSKGESAR
mmetsp:Transcript_36046/g.119387  ORF Transcript_36046/g.119387 Transcript_36046/m.119387 type:complete len:284 (-) Transcript_36046:2539-3390(-)